jgi:hypothetical protein
MLREISAVRPLRFLISPICSLTLSCVVRIRILFPGARILIFAAPERIMILACIFEKGISITGINLSFSRSTSIAVMTSHFVPPNSSGIFSGCNSSFMSRDPFYFTGFGVLVVVAKLHA